MNIVIEKAILHLVSNNFDKPVLSEKQITLTDEIYITLNKYLAKTLNNDDLKLCSFNENSYFFNFLEKENDFIKLSKDLTELYYEKLKLLDFSNDENILYIRYKMDNQDFICIMLFPFKKALVSTVTFNNNIAEIEIVSNNSVLPNFNQKISNAIIINLQNFSIGLLEQPVMIGSEKTNYLSTVFLDCQSKISNKQKLDVINKAIEKINDEYYENDLDNEITCKTVINKELLEKGKVKVEEIPKKIFKEEAIQKEFKKILDDNEIDGSISNSHTRSQLNKYNLKSIRTNNGIEIKIPLEEDIINNYIQFINNADGTISILIKNIESYK